MTDCSLCLSILECDQLTSCCVVQDVDEKLLYDTFSAFGVIVTNPKVHFHPVDVGVDF